eukprot:TRINITY_DN8165_c0_g1_i1.p1 TRINITY_DN8165_c0_g1~~TRINITY_DN8165_c0_g1_i1.p1  ORF type:complete len:354 (+),score=84.75 TRINITY_DN8165_c0_g1_i1:54-1115(+)
MLPVCRSLRNIRLTTHQSKRTLRQHASGNKIVTVIPGDGVGPEICDSAIGIIQASGAPVSFDIFHSGRTQDTLSGDLLASLSRNEVALKGPLFTPKGEVSSNQRLRVMFSLYANVVHCKSMDSIKTRHNNIDIVVVRENIEGEYTGMESEIVPGIVQSLKVTTASKSKRIAEFAFNLAKKEGRKKVTAIHKANIMKLTDGLFLEKCREVAKENPSIAYDEMIIDNTCMQLVMKPSQFDVMVTPNLYGHMVSNTIAGLLGGAGLLPGVNYGNRLAVFESARHTAKDLEGKNVANPIGMVLSSIRLLRHVGLDTYADKINNALVSVIDEGKVRTMDIGGTSSTTEFTNAVIKRLA